ncbi:MAG: hypothetical protein Q9188_004409, partial [Gyalolechia gomerana]
MIFLPSSSNALLVIISLSSFLASHPCHAFRCFPSPSSLLPPYRDCRVIIAGIDWLSTRATERGPRDWGRAVHTAATTERLPKFFMIQGRQPPNVCAVEVDVDPIDYYAIDTFTLEEVAEAAK